MTADPVFARITELLPVVRMPFAKDKAPAEEVPIVKSPPFKVTPFVLFTITFDTTRVAGISKPVVLEAVS